MSLALRTLALAAIAITSVAGFTAVSAQEPTPTATPVPTSTITIRFVSNGEPFKVWLPEIGPQRILADGVPCSYGRATAVVQVSEWSQPWPFPPEEGQPVECTKGPPTTLRFEFSSEFGWLSIEFVWTGEDVTVDIEVPESTTPTATPTPLVEELPTTGTSPGNSASQSAWTLIAIAAGSLIIAAGTFLCSRR